MIKKRVLSLWAAALTLPLLLCAPLSRAQDMGGANTNSQMASSTSSMGEGINSNETNLYTGTAQFFVPIYAYGESGAFGVNLNYDCKGVQADQLSSAVGLNWSLAAGGSIQRVVKDIPDELFLPNIYDDIEDYWGGYVDYRRLLGRLAVGLESPAEAAMGDTYRDKESDEFVVSAGGLSFSFYIGNKGAIFTHPNRRVQITYLHDGMPITSLSQLPAFTELRELGFRIRDEAGNSYYFSCGELKQEKLSSAYNTELRDIVIYMLPKNWNLDKVVFADGKSIRYYYHNKSIAERFQPEYQFYQNTIDDKLINNTSNISNIYLDSILYPNRETVAFEYASESCAGVHALEQIKVRSESACKVYALEHAYFVADYPGRPGNELPYGGSHLDIKYVYQYDPIYPKVIGTDMLLRLKLKGIRLRSCDGIVEEPYYSFDYDPTPIGIRGSGADFFGYYNGKSLDNYTFTHFGDYHFFSLPSHTIWPDSSMVLSASIGHSKDPDFNYMKAGVLTQVTNAHGGKTLFRYGPHTGLTNPLESYLALPTLPTFLGKQAYDGLRIDSLIEEQPYGHGTRRVTVYTYEDGQRFLPGGFFNHYTSQGAQPTDKFDGVVWLNRPVSGMQSVNGSYHGYGKVTVRTFNELGENISKQEVTFTNMTDATTAQPRYQLNGSGGKHYFQFPYTHKQYLRDWEMGLPLTVTDYDVNGLILNKTVNEYKHELDLATAASKGVLNERVALIEHFDAPILATNWSARHQTVRDLRAYKDTYVPYTGESLLRRQTHYTYQSNTAYTVDSTVYTYDERNNLKDAQAWESDGTSKLSRNVYNYAVEAPVGHPLSVMTAAGLENLVGIEQWKYQGGGKHLLGASIFGLVYDGSRIYPSASWELASAGPLSDCEYTGNCGGPGVPLPYQQIIQAYSGATVPYFQKVMETTHRDAAGNVLESRSMDREQYAAAIWDTAYGHKRAEAQGARYDEIAYTSFDYYQPPFSEATVWGNWQYDAAGIATTSNVPGTSFGERAYQLSAAQPGRDIRSVNALNGDKDFVLTFWCSGNLPRLEAGGSTVALSSEHLLQTVGAWSQYRARFAGNWQQVRLWAPASGSCYVDELRLFPVGASFLSWTYLPLWGIGSVTGTTGRTGYVEYDGLGRKYLERDQEGNILLKVEQKTH